MLFATIITLFNGLFILYIENQHKISLLNKAESSKLKVPVSHPDIIWILLDEYASNPQLMKLGYTNHMGDSLRKRGFYVWDSIATRYDHTELSISSLFNLDDTIQPSNYKYSEKYIMQNVVKAAFISNGYSFTSLDFLHFNEGENDFDLPGLFPYSYLSEVLNGTVISDFWFRYFNNYELKTAAYNLKVQTALSEKFLSHKKKQPAFIWAHFLMPHSPFLKDSTGKSLHSGIISNSTIQNINNNYINYLAYTNHTILDILSIIDNLNNKIIIISGDHGFRFYLNPSDKYRKETFAAIYLPNTNFTKTNQLKNIRFIQQILSNIK